MEKVKKFFDDTSRFIFVSSVVIMIIAHGFCFMNIMFSHDSLSFAEIDGLDKVGLGRWLYPFLAHRRLIATPWLMGALSIFYVSLAVVLVSKVLELSRLQGMCVAILFGTNVTLTSLFCTYVFDADADCLGLLFACIAVYSFRKFPKILNIVIPVISVVICLALYQAYICVAIGLYILILIKDAMNSESWNDILKVFICGIKELSTLLLGIIVYIPLMHAAAGHYGVELSNEYNGAGNLSSLTAAGVINDIPVSYEYFRDYFFSITEYNSLSMVRVSWLIAILIVISVVYYILKHRKFLGSLVIVIPCLIIFPLGLNAIHLVSFGLIHQLMIFAFCLVYMLPIVIVDISQEKDDGDQAIDKVLSYSKKAVYAITVIAIVYIGFSNIVYSNGAYLYKKLVYDNTALHAQTIWKDINCIDGYNEGVTEVVFMGDFSASKIAYKGIVGDRYFNVLTGAGNSSITYPKTANAFFYNILGRDLIIVHDDAGLADNTDYIEMPAYPRDGYCKMIGDRVVVKLQN